MRDDFKNKFSNNRRVFSFNHVPLYMFFARYFYLRGRRETGKLPSDFHRKGRRAAFLANSEPRYYYYYILFIFCVHALSGFN